MARKEERTKVKLNGDHKKFQGGGLYNYNGSRNQNISPSNNKNNQNNKKMNTIRGP